MEQYEQKIEALLKQMTLEEKVGQLQQCGPSLVGAFDVSFEELINMMFDGKITQEEFNRLRSTAEQDFHEDDLRAGKIGSYNGVDGAETVNRLQKIAVEETRLGIPLLFGSDVIHGFRTVTPIPLAESCAWDEDLWERTGRMAAQEATAAGVNLTFAPMVDVAKDARWGRVSESAGEDVLLNGAYGAAKVRGFQTADPTAPHAMAACVKHFAAYGAVEAGRDYNRVDMSPQKLFEEYLPAYRQCIEAGAKAVMPAFNDINGIPCSVNTHLLQTILREQWGFKGVTISDANAIAECVEHGIARDRADAGAKALAAGMDIDMTSNVYAENLVELVKSGRVPEAALDRAVRDVLRVKFEMGLFDHPYRTDAEREAKAFLGPKARALALEAAQKSMVLLKNEPVDGAPLLPLPKDVRLGIFGELAADRADMLGAWSIKGNGEDCVSLVDACEQQGLAYAYSAAYDAQVADGADVLLVALGEKKDESGEAASKADIALPAQQIALVRRLAETGKPIVAVLFNGRPMAIPYVAETATALLEAWHPGVEAGRAIVDILLGAVNPSGKLTTTFPYATGQCPLYYAHINTGRPGGRAKFTSKYQDTPLVPVFPFGFGQSYTQFAYSDLAAEVIGAGEDAALAVRVTVKNVGARSGDEIAQCYVQLPVGGRVHPVKQLKAFRKCALAAGEQTALTWRIPVQELAYYDWDMQRRVDPGVYTVYAGGSSADCLETEVTLRGI